MPRLSIFCLSGPPLPLPDGVSRTYVATQSGNLELLCAEPQHTQNRKSPLFFAHGGCGSAAVWLEWMIFFSHQHDIPCYAVSYRGHGASWYPNFVRMYFTGKRSFALDLAAGINFVRQKERKDVVLVGHSSGGALSQLILNDGIGDVRVKGLALCASMPGFGGFGVNRNWMRMDPWMVLRMMFFHFGHPMSPLSSTFLVKQAFFCDAYPTERVIEFEKRMPRMESFAWPMGQNFRFATFKNVLQRIVGWGTTERVLIMAGEKDRLVSKDIKQQEAQEARDAFKELVDAKKIEAKEEEVVGSADLESKGLGVRWYIVKGAGHHLQNDLQSRDGATKLLAFYEQL